MSPSAPVPPDANGLRERMQRVLDDELANLADDGARLSHAVVRRMEAVLAASEAAPTAGEEVGCQHGMDSNSCPWDTPATPPADDASEGLSDGEQGRLLSSIYSILGTHRIKPHGADLHRKVVATVNDILAARESAAATCEHGQTVADLCAALRAAEDDADAAATRARAEGAKEAGERIARAILDARHGWHPEVQRGFTKAASIARSDAAPHTGGPS